MIKTFDDIATWDRLSATLSPSFARFQSSCLWIIEVPRVGNVHVIWVAEDQKVLITLPANTKRPLKNNEHSDLPLLRGKIRERDLCCVVARSLSQQKAF